MANISKEEKRALEEIFIVLNDKKYRRIESVKKYIMFYKHIKIFSRKRLLLVR